MAETNATDDEPQSAASFVAPAMTSNLFSGDIQFIGRAGEIVGLVIKNFLLNILTFGFYRFWARTNVRRYIWDKMYVFGSPLEYTGTGKELFVGFLLIVFIVFLPWGILNGVLEATGLLQNEMASVAFAVFTYAAIFFLIGVATWRALRYRLSRTRWRSIRLGLTGSSGKYGCWFFLYIVLQLFLRLFEPIESMHLWRLRMQNTHVGTRFFTFDPENIRRKTLARLYKLYAVPTLARVIMIVLPILYLLSIFDWSALDTGMSQEEINLHFSRQLEPHHSVLNNWPYYLPVALIVLAVSSAWYKLREISALVTLTKFEDVDLSFNATLVAYLKVYIGNLVILLITLGIGLPFTQVRNARFIASHLQADGQLDLARITQSADDDLTSGEGLADAFDMGAV